MRVQIKDSEDAEDSEESEESSSESSESFESSASLYSQIFPRHRNHLPPLRWLSEKPIRQIRLQCVLNCLSHCTSAEFHTVSFCRDRRQRIGINLQRNPLFPLHGRDDRRDHLGSNEDGIGKRKWLEDDHFIKAV